MIDLFDFVQTRQQQGASILGNYRVHDLNLVTPSPQTFIFTVEGQSEHKGKTATIAVRANVDQSETFYDVDRTDDGGSTLAYSRLPVSVVVDFLETGTIDSGE